MLSGQRRGPSGSTVLTGGVALSASQRGFIFFQKILNSAVSLKNHRKIIRGSKILKIFVYPLDDIFYLGKI
jgi:hypothetical protein